MTGAGYLADYAVVRLNIFAHMYRELRRSMAEVLGRKRGCEQVALMLHAPALGRNEAQQVMALLVERMAFNRYCAGQRDRGPYEWNRSRYAKDKRL